MEDDTMIQVSLIKEDIRQDWFISLTLIFCIMNRLSASAKLTTVCTSLKK